MVQRARGWLVGPDSTQMRAVLAAAASGRLDRKVDLDQARALIRAATLRLRQADDLVALMVLTQEGWQRFQRTRKLTFRVLEGRV